MAHFDPYQDRSTSKLGIWAPGLAEHFVTFLNKLNKFNNTGARMLDYIYHMTLKLIKNRIDGVKTSKILPCFTLRYNQSDKNP